MDAVVLYNVSDVCDTCAKLIIKLKDKIVKVEMWTNYSERVLVSEEKYPSVAKAEANYYMKIGKAIKGKWKVLNVFPQGETW